MKFINRIEGAVFFVDILGVSALTENKLKLDDNDFNDWLNQYGLEHNNQYLAASILGEFRKILNDLKNQFNNIKISQLSDCAFIWSENVTDVLIAANNLMSKAVVSGILCRGGLAYGEIIETTQNYDLGRFIVGSAVTRAAKLEGLAKGARIMMDQEFPNAFWEKDKTFDNRINEMFKPFINPLDFQTYDEFKWYLVPNLDSTVKDLSISDYDYRLSLTKQRLNLATKIRLSPKFYWNSKSPQGLVQLRATLSFMTENKLLDINHNFDWTEPSEKRSNEIVKNVECLITTDKDYSDEKASVQHRI